MGKGSREGKGGKGKGGKQPEPAAAWTGAAGSGATYGFKFLATEAAVPAIIGKGGSVIAGMRSSCKARLSFTEYGEVFPGTDLRVLTCQAQEEASIGNVISQVLPKMAEAAAEEAEAGTDELSVHVLVPRAAAGSLIGKAGATVKQLRESTGAKINIQEAVVSGPAVDQQVSVAGDEASVKKVLLEVSRHIQALSGEGWFASWISTPGTVSWEASSLATTAGRATSSYSAGVDLITKVAQSLPPYVIEDSRGFALSCVIPNHLVGGLIGRGGAGTREIQTLTGAKIGIRDIPDDPDNRTLNIAGPFPSACAAYMLMMKRYLDVEEQAGSWSYD